MADITKRVNYFDRQFLRATDFQDDTAYQLDRRRRHNRLLHGSGIAEGMTVTGNVGDTFVTVAPGTAYDDLGQEIVLPARQDGWRVAVAGKSPVYVTIAYSEQLSDPSSDPGVTGYTRMAENPTPVPSATPPLDPDPNHALLLATITLDNNQKVSAVDTNPPGRKRAGVLPPNSVSIRELKASVVVQGTVGPIAVNSWKRIPGFILPTPQPAGFYIPNIVIKPDATPAPVLAISWQEEYMVLTSNNVTNAGRVWKITNSADSAGPVTVSYTIHKLEES